MKLIQATIISLLNLLLVLSAFATATPLQSEGTLFQVATIGSLVQGVYDGDYSYKQLFEHGDFGLGTFNNLDGEMVAVDGKFYKITANGKLSLVKSSDQTPFAEVTFFNPKSDFSILNVADFANVSQMLERKFENKNIPYAIRIDGNFHDLKLRSLRAQTKPYPALTLASKNQATFAMKHAKGTIIGFWFPPYMSALGVAGLHLHFVTADRSTGGHILEMAVDDGMVLIEPLPQLSVALPNTTSFAKADLMDKNIHTATITAEGSH